MSKSVIQDGSGRGCYLCGLLDGDPWDKEVLQEHHIFGGPRRRKSEQYGLKVRLCFAHHGAKGDRDVHRPDRNDYGLLLKMIGQTVFEQKYGHERFMKEFGKNYLEDRNDDDDRKRDSDGLSNGEG